TLRLMPAERQGVPAQQHGVAAVREPAVAAVGVTAVAGVRGVAAAGLVRLRVLGARAAARIRRTALLLRLADRDRCRPVTAVGGGRAPVRVRVTARDVASPGVSAKGPGVAA